MFYSTLSTLSWQAAVVDFVEASGVSQASIARAIGISVGAFNHYLTGRRTPTEATTARINVGLANALHVPELDEYLGAIAEEQGLLPTRMKTLEGADSLLKRFIGQFPIADGDGFQKVTTLSADETRRFAGALNAVWRKRLLGAVNSGRLPPLLDDLKRVFRKFDIPLEFQPSCDFSVYYADEELRSVVHEVLVDAALPTPERNRTLEKIMNAHFAAVQAAEDRAIDAAVAMTKMQYLRETPEPVFAELTARYGQEESLRIMKCVMKRAERDVVDESQIEVRL